MIKLSQRDFDNKEQSPKDIIMNNISRLRINEKWEEYIEKIHEEADEAIKNYVKDEYQKTDIYRKIKMINEQWDNLKKTNQLTPEKERVLSDQLYSLEREEIDTKDELYREVNELKNIIINDIIKSKSQYVD